MRHLIWSGNIGSVKVSQSLSFHKTLLCFFPELDLKQKLVFPTLPSHPLTKCPQSISTAYSYLVSHTDRKWNCGQNGLDSLQGDPSGSSQPPVDIKTKVAFQYMLLILIHNFCFDVNRRLETT